MMTREEAIRIISGEVLGTTEQTHEAVAMAVKALSVQHEITEDDVKEWLHKRRLVVIDAVLYWEMKRKCAGCVYEPIEGVL